jgi:uncharacterized damage-inducible protein DinB
MALVDSLLPEFDHEMGTTRRLLERVPDGALSWKPHERSMTLGQLAGHLAQIPHWSGIIVRDSGFDLANATGRADDPRQAATKDEMVAAFVRNVAEARALIVGLSDPELLTGWTLKRDGRQLFTVPRISALRTFLLNHSIHHRGQLSVYLRLQNVPLPPIYGPTADEGI